MRTFLALATAIATTLAVSPTVNLDYAAYEGTALNNGVTQWLGVRFAAPPTGDLRFSAPQDPKKENDTVQADEHGKLCLSTGTDPPDDEHDEDCLFLDIYAPSNATTDEPLPIYFFIQGGGFNGLSNANYNGSGLIEASGHNIVIVSINYRVGLYGFLASEEVKAGGAINAGLLDQRKALHWVQKYISSFGGNPRHVVLAGDSAGAQSVTLHVTAYGGRDDGLFHATAAESQSFSALRTVEESQFAYINLVIRTNCVGPSNTTLSCLRNLSATELQSVNINTPFPGAQQTPLYMYGPVLDYDFVSDYTLRAYEQGKFVRVPAIYGDDTNEGTTFTPRNTSSYGESDTFLQSQFPALTSEQLGRINELYPVEGTPQFNGTGRFWRQVSDAYGELRYICPGIFVSETLAKYGFPSWNYHWNVIDPEDDAEGLGVTHTVEIHAIWGPDNTQGTAPLSYYANGTNGAIVPVTQGYWISFVRAFDPNEFRVEGTPVWEEWGGSKEVKGYNGNGTSEGYQRLMFRTNETRMETVPEGQRGRCGYLLGIGVDIKQ